MNQSGKKYEKAERVLKRVLKRMPAARDLIRYKGMIKFADEERSLRWAPMGKWWVERAHQLLRQDEADSTKKAEQRLVGLMHRALLHLREREEQARGRAVEQALLERAGSSNDEAPNGDPRDTW